MRQRLKTVKDRIRKVAESCGRDPGSVRLVAVSKTMPADRVREAIASGVTILGENYIQEAREKIAELSEHPVSWHFIGHLQTNKSKYAVKLFDLIHSVDSLRLARELNKQAGKINKVQEILIQVNLSEEASKSGTSSGELKELATEISQLEHIAVKGLMTMPPFFDEPERAKPFFSELRRLRNQVGAAAIPNLGMDELSMGMTGDFEVAIQEGATLVRIGTAIFGQRM